MLTVLSQGTTVAQFTQDPDRMSVVAPLAHTSPELSHQGKAEPGPPQGGVRAGTWGSGHGRRELSAEVRPMNKGQALSLVVRALGCFWEEEERLGTQSGPPSRSHQLAQGDCPPCLLLPAALASTPVGWSWRSARFVRLTQMGVKTSTLSVSMT